MTQDSSSSSPIREDPPPPTPPPDNKDTFATVPPGWTTHAHPTDGRLFYWHAATGISSWTHPLLGSSTTTTTPKTKNWTTDASNTDAAFQYMPAPNTTSTSKEPSSSWTTPLPPPPTNHYHHHPTLGVGEDPYMANKRPDNHQCQAVACLVLCLPLGLLAMYHSVRVDQCWKGREYSDAVVASRQSQQYSSWGNFIGVIFWICWFFFRRGRGEWEWPDWRLGE
jgi:hypothetical protein